MTSQPTQQGLDTILEIATLMAKDDCQAQNVAKRLGQIQSGGEPNVPLKVKPSDSAFSAVRVAHNEAGEPTQVTLELVKPLPMEALVAAFGDYDTPPRLPNTKEPPRVSFDLQIEKAEHEVTLFASYESGGSAATSQVSRMMLFRD